MERLYSCLEDLPQRHVALHLLRLIVSFGRVQYLCRIAPRTFLHPLLDYCHDRIRVVVESILGESLTRDQWLQVWLPIRLGGFGIGTGRDEQGMYVVQLADLMYLTSRRATKEVALGMLPGEHVASGSFESAAILHLEPFVGPHSGTIKDATANLPSRDLLAFLHEKT